MIFCADQHLFNYPIKGLSSLGGGIMKVLRGILFGPVIAVFLGVFVSPVPAQEKVRLAHSALESSNSVWYVAKDRGLYKKHGLDADLLFIPSTTNSVSSLVAGDGD